MHQLLFSIPTKLRTQVTLFFVLATNQYFVGGLYGPFYNPAIHMNVLLHAQLKPSGILNLTLHRNQGPDTYGDFIIDVLVNSPDGKTILHYDQKQLSQLSNNQIHNQFIVKVSSNAHALVLPLGSLATIDFTPPFAMQLKPGSYQVTVTDIGGQSWHTIAMVGDESQRFVFDPYTRDHSKC